MDRVHDNTAITHHDGGTTLTGDAITMYRGAVLRGALGLYIKCKMIPTRGMTIGKLLNLATEITKKPYKNNAAGWQAAHDDVDTWVKTMKAAIPHVDETTREGGAA